MDGRFSGEGFLKKVAFVANQKQKNGAVYLSRSQEQHELRHGTVTVYDLGQGRGGECGGEGQEPEGPAQVGKGQTMKGLSVPLQALGRSSLRVTSKAQCEERGRPGVKLTADFQYGFL